MALAPGQVINDRYRVIALLSQGGMGAVYEAIDLSLDVRCALKEMVPYPGTSETVLPQLREQFRQEAQLLADLRHPNMPRVTDHFEEDSNAYLVMDFVYGKRLDEIIAQEGGLAEDEVLGWARQLMEALTYCHEQGVIHRDVKPGNVVITPQGRPMLVDFGLAKLIDPDQPRTRTVMRGIGTPEYAPPEQYDAKKGYTDARTDIYSLAATLYHALTGEAPPTVTEQIVNPKSLLPPRQYRNDLSEVTERVLMKAMALQPPQRFQNVAEMHKALFDSPLPKVKAESTAFSEGGTGMLVEPPAATILLPWIGTAKRRIDRRIWVAIAAVTIILVTVVLVADGINAGNIPTATTTPTATVTMAPTHTPTATPSSTATLTASPTSRPTVRQPTETSGEFFDTSPSPTPASPTPTRVYIPPSPTHTPIPTPTNTRRPAPTRTRIPSPVPTDVPPEPPTPTLAPTSIPEPTATAPRPTIAPRPVSNSSPYIHAGTYGNSKTHT